MKLTQEEVCDALAMINALATFCALHGVQTKPYPNLVKLVDWVEDEYGIKKESDHDN